MYSILLDLIMYPLWTSYGINIILPNHPLPFFTQNQATKNLKKNVICFMPVIRNMFTSYISYV